jgi:hypothetical protein
VGVLPNLRAIAAKFRWVFRSQPFGHIVGLVRAFEHQEENWFLL